MTQDLAITARFAAATFMVRVDVAGDGSVASTTSDLSCPERCAIAVPYRSVVRLVASSTATASFAGWGGACSGTGDCSITVVEDTTVSAAFAADRELFVAKTGNGGGAVTSSPTGISCGSDCAESYGAVTEVTLTAAPDADSVFAGWAGGGCTGTDPCIVHVDAAVSVTATFTPRQLALTIARVGNGGGTVASSPAGISCGGDCSESYDVHTVITLTATPAADSVFVGWSGGGCTGTGSCIVALDGALTVTASFALVPFSVAIMKAGNGSGTVTSNPAGISCGTDCAESYDAHTVVTLTATPAADSVFTGWSSTGCPGTGPCTVTVDQALTVTASFALKRFALTVNRTGNAGGIVTSSPPGISCGTDCAESYDVHTVVTLTATPSPGARFTGWSGGCTGIDVCTVTIEQAVAITASFVLPRFAVTIAKPGNGHGTVTSSPAGISCGDDCSESYDVGTFVRLNATAAADSFFTGWSGANCSAADSCSFFTNEPTSVAAMLILKKFELTVATFGTSFGTVTSSPTGIACGDDCSESYDAHTLVTLSATPGNNSSFAGWSGGGCTGTGTCVVTMDQAARVTARFDRIPHFLLRVNRQGTGSGRVISDVGGIDCGPNCVADLNQHTVITLTAQPAADSQFSGWGPPCGGTGTCVLEVNSAVDLVARFNRVPAFTVQVTRNGDGSGTVTSSPGGISCGSTCSGDFALGTSATLTATVGPNSVFTGWSGSCSGTGACVVSSSVVGTVPVSATFPHVRMVASNFQSPSSLVVFPIEATGDAAPQAVISGPNTTMRNVNSVVVANGEIFAIDRTANAIVVFPTTASGNVAPTRRIAGPNTGFGTGLISNAAVFDGEIYVPQTDGTISVFPKDADGDVAPARVISGLGDLTYLVIFNREIYVTDRRRIEVLPVDASGPVTPTRVIMGEATGLNFPGALLVNSDNLFVSDAGAIRVYARTASGNAAPLRVLTGTATKLSVPTQMGIFNEDLYVVDESVLGDDLGGSGILVFAATATGNTAPRRKIKGPSTSLVSAFGLFIYP